MFSKKCVSIGCLALLCTALTCFGQAVPEPSDEWSGSVTIGGDVKGDAQLVADGVYEVTGAGADVWGTSDQFHYVYKELTGDGTISCRVADFGTGTNTWAKGGVMIRETLDANSKHTIMAMTGGAGAGITFQGRITGVGAASTGMHSDITAAPPQWVKLTREGNTFTAYYSADGVAWELFTDTTPDAGHSNPIDVEMAATVKIGLFVTSHAKGQLRTYTIDNVSMEGDIVGENTYVPTAYNPVPADGATELVAPISLQWDLALGATAYDVYVSEDADIDAAALVGTTTETTYAIDTIPGATYYWRVDTADAALNTYQGAAWQFSMLSDQAHNPSPADGGQWSLGINTVLSWTPGLGALAHNVYVSADKALVDARDPSVGFTFWLMDTFAPGDLVTGTTYYWAVDEFSPPLTIAGPTWSFNAFKFDPIAITDPNMVIYYTFDGITGGLINDLSGHEHYGIVMGDAQIGTADGVTTLDFDGINDYVYTGLSASDLGIGGNNARTVTSWVYTRSYGGGGIFDVGNRAAGQDFCLRTLDNIDGQWRIQYWGGDMDFNYDSTEKWVHFALVHDGVATKVYANGELIVDWEKTIDTPDTNPFQVGLYGWPGNYFDGLIGDLRVYNKALSQEEVQGAMKEGDRRKPLIAFVSFHAADDAPSSGAVGDGFTEAADKGYTDLLIANGYDVVRVITSKTPDVNTLNGADLVITSRSVNSGDYSNDGATLWNGITSPMIILGGYTLRDSRMGYTLGGTMVDTVGDITLTINDPTHPIFAGIQMYCVAGSEIVCSMVNPFAGVVSYDDGTLCRGVSVNTNEVNAEGTILATVATADDPTAGGMMIGEWQAGATLTHAGGAGTDILAAHRLVFLTGSRENGKNSQTAGLYDLYEDGATMFLNAIEYMLQ